MLSLLAGLALVAGAVPAEVTPGTPIVTIRIVRVDIFDVNDPETSAWPYRLADSLHVTTQEKLIRSLLLFREGDRLDYDRLAESERLLRDSGFLSPVTITAHPAPGGAEVVVETHDQWTTKPGIHFGKVGNRSKYGIELTEENFLGLGKHVEVDWNDDAERRWWGVVYKDPLFLATRWKLSLTHRTATDGRTHQVSFEYPFYALATRFAGGVEWDDQTQREYLYSFGKKVVSGDVSVESARAWGGILVPIEYDAVDRLTVGVFRDVSSYEDWLWTTGEPYEPPVGHDLQGVEVGWERVTDRWQVVQGFRGFQRQEDLPLGPNWNVSLGFSLPSLGGEGRRQRVTGAFYAGRSIGKTFSWLSAGASGRLEGAHPVNAVTHLEVGSKHIGDAGWLAHAMLDWGYKLDRDRQLALGADVGLRGWDPSTFDGTSRAVLNLEWRMRLTDEVLHFGVFGISAFVDAGRTWGARVGPGSDGWRGDAGVGVLFESTRAPILKMTRLEVGFPDDGSGPVWLLLSGSVF